MSAPRTPRAARRWRTTVPGGPWALMLRWGAVPAAVVLVALGAVALLASGAGAAGSTLLAAAVVGIPFALSGLSLWWASGLSAYAPPLVMLGLYAVLVVFGVILIETVVLPAWFRPPWAAVAAIAHVGAWLGGFALGLSRARIPVFDLSATPATRRSQDGSQHGSRDRPEHRPDDATHRSSEHDENGS